MTSLRFSSAQSAQRVEERLPRREVAVDGAHDDPGADRDERDGELVDRVVGEDLRRRLEDPQPGLLELLGPQWALVATRRAHGTRKIIEDTLSCQENMHPCHEVADQENTVVSSARV